MITSPLRKSTADVMRFVHGESLIGQRVKTIPLGDWPGGEAVVTDLGHDDNAPEIVMNVRKDDGAEIGVFYWEPIELVGEPVADGATER